MTKMLFVMENVSNRKAFSGGRYHGWIVAKAIQSAGHKVTVLTSVEPVWVKDLPGDMPNVVESRRLNARSVRNWVDANGRGYDLIGVMPIRATEWAVSAARRMGIPCWSWVLDPYLMVSSYAQSVAGRMAYTSGYRSALKNSSRIIASVRTAVPYVQEWVGNVPVSVLTPCINSVMADKINDAKSSGTFEVLAIMRDVPHKRPNYVFRAFEFLRRHYRNSHLTVVSGFVASRWRGVCRRLNIADAVTFKPQCSEEEKWRLLKRSNVLLHAAIYEGLCLPLAEAIYACTVPVMFDFGVYREVAFDGGAYWAEYDSPSSLAAKLVEAAKNQNDCKRLMHLTAIANEYSFDALVKRTKELF